MNPMHSMLSGAKRIYTEFLSRDNIFIFENSPKEEIFILKYTSRSLFICKYGASITIIPCAD
jgi:hypothetical protein